jgi:hypothetical protein
MNEQTEVTTATAVEPDHDVGQFAGAFGDEVATITAQTMLGELMACTLDELKQARDVWQKLPQTEQDRVIERIQNRTSEAIRQAVHMISAKGFTQIPATLEQVVAKDGLKAVVLPSAHGPEKYSLIDAVGTTVTIVLANPGQYAAGKHGHKSEPNQRALELPGDEEGDESEELPEGVTLVEINGEPVEAIPASEIPEGIRRKRK